VSQGDAATGAMIETEATTLVEAATAGAALTASASAGTVAADFSSGLGVDLLSDEGIGAG